MIRVLFVCTGNICRSPTAEGVFRRLVAEAGLSHRIEADSAGTIDYHAGRPPDTRARQAAARRGIDIGDLRARQITVEDFEAFDYIVTMDARNLEHVRAGSPGGHEGKLHAFLEFAPERSETEVPDPYYGGEHGFEYVLDLVEEAARGLLATVRRDHGI